MSVVIAPEDKLQFKLDAKDFAEESLCITNDSEKSIIFKIKTTAPEEYTVRPALGRIEAHEKLNILLTYRPKQHDKRAATTKGTQDKFMIITADGDNSEQFKTLPDNKLNRTKIVCEFVPSQKESPSSLTDTQLSSILETSSNKPIDIMMPNSEKKETRGNGLNSLRIQVKDAEQEAAKLARELAQRTPKRSQSGRKLSSMVQPNDAVHDYLARLEQPRSKEGYPLQVLIIIAAAVFVFTYLFF